MQPTDRSSIPTITEFDSRQHVPGPNHLLLLCWARQLVFIASLFSCLSVSWITKIQAVPGLPCRLEKGWTDLAVGSSRLVYPSGNEQEPAQEDLQDELWGFGQLCREFMKIQ